MKPLHLPLEGHDLLAVERFKDDTRHMAEFLILSTHCPLGRRGQYKRLFLTEDEYARMRSLERQGQLQIRRHAAIIEGHMHKDSTAQAKQKKDEREEVLKEIRQLENRQKILENKQRNEERKARTRRLIERGAILEGIFPLAPDLPGVEVKAFLIALSHLPGAAELAAKLPKSGDKP